MGVDTGGEHGKPYGHAQQQAGDHNADEDADS